MTSDIPVGEGKSGEEEKKHAILEEIPENLIRLGLHVAKAFYGRDHYVVFDYIQRSTCIKEDDLRNVLKFDHRFLRTERFVAEEADGRARKTNYYFINYRALLNVAKYKIDHMRQRLEVRDKDEVHKASYKCSGCKHHYDAMEMDKIFDPMTQELRCWRCQQIVNPDETAGPTDETRSSLARFNDQMAPLFSMIQNLDGIRLATHLLEPVLKAESVVSDGHEKILSIGERAFTGHTASSRSIMYQNGITVSIDGGSNSAPIVEEKKMVPWLQSQLQSPPPVSKPEDSTHSAFVDLVDNPDMLGETTENEPVQNNSEIDSLLIEEFGEAKSHQPSHKKSADSVVSAETSEEEDIITVGGVKYYIDEITPELVHQMSSKEKEMYIRLTQEGFDF